MGHISKLTCRLVAFAGSTGVCDVFFGFLLLKGVASFTLGLLRHSRIAVVLDLDDTLILSSSPQALARKMERVDIKV